MHDNSSNALTRGARAGWLTVATCFLMALFAWGTGFYAHGIYLIEIQKHTGWSTSFIASVVTGHYLLSALLLMGVADAMDRLGPRTVVLSATALQAIGLALLPLVEQRWQLVAIYGLFALAWTGMSSVPIATLVGRWFERRRGLALNLALSGATAAGILIAPALLYLNATRGFAQATQWLALAMLALLGPAVLMLVRWPAPGERELERLNGAASGTRGPSQMPAPTRRQVLRRSDFWSIAAAFALALLVQVGFLTQQVAVLRGALTDAQIGLAIALTTGSALVGRIGMAMLIDRIDQRRASALAFISQAAALMAIASTQAAPALLAACVVYGFSVGNVITLAALIVQKEFAPQVYGTVVGLTTGIGQLTYSFGPAVFGWLRDTFGGYRAPLVVGVVLYGVAAILIVSRGPGHRPRTQPASPGRP
ncbi:MAG: MFS transporter [Burkholderiaceae bacterium]|nr:MFS transporter [Burkholderiaceae bacterium]